MSAESLAFPVCLVVAVSGGAALASAPDPTAFASAASCPECTIGPISRVRLPYTGVEAWASKLFKPENGAIIPVTLLADGSVVEHEKLKQDDYAAQVARFGKLAPGLGEALETIAETDLVDVVIWTNTQIRFPPRAELLRSRVAVDAFQATAVGAYSAAAFPIAAWMSARGITTYSTASDSPRLHAQLSKAQIRDLASLDAVLRIEGAVKAIPLQAQSHPPFPCQQSCVPDCGGDCPIPAEGCTSNATLAWWQTINMDAASAMAPSSLSYNKICIFDEGGPRDTTYLRMGAIRFPYQFSSHTQAVAGILSNTLGPSITNATIVSSALDDYCRHYGSEPCGAGTFEYCLANGPTPVVNISMQLVSPKYSGDDPSKSEGDFYSDFLAKMYPYPLFVLAAGNSGDDPSVPTPWVVFRGYNSIIVGASDDKGTPSHDDDTIAKFSSWANPPKTHGDYELPHLVAPGVGIASANMTYLPDSLFPVEGQSIWCPAVLDGTSFAAPQVAGVASLVFNSDPYGWPSSFLGCPEMLKAVLMATTSLNVPTDFWNGMPQFYNRNGSYEGIFRHLTAGGPADRNDGVGILDAAAALRLARSTCWVEPGASPAPRGRWAGVIHLTDGTPDVDPNTGYLYQQWNLVGEHTGWMKFVAAWEGTPLGCNYNSSETGGGVFPRYCNSNQIDADLDLAIFDSAGRPVCTSTSWDSSWEACNFPVSQGERFVARLSVGQIFNGQTHLGIAWDNHLLPSYGVPATRPVGTAMLALVLLAVGIASARRRHMRKAAACALLVVALGTLSCTAGSPLPASTDDAGRGGESDVEVRVAPTEDAAPADRGGDDRAEVGTVSRTDAAIVDRPAEDGRPGDLLNGTMDLGGASDADSLDSSIVPSCQGAPLMGTPEQIASTPRRYPLLELVAMSLDPNIVVARQEDYDRIEADVTAIAGSNAWVGRTLSTKSLTPPTGFIDGSRLVLAVDVPTYTAMQAGTYEAWDCLNNYYGVTDITFYTPAGATMPTVILSLKGTYNTETVSGAYRALPGVLSCNPRRSPTDYPSGSIQHICAGRSGDTYRYAFKLGYGDCVAGCTTVDSVCYESISSGNPRQILSDVVDGGRRACFELYDRLCAPYGDDWSP